MIIPRDVPLERLLTLISPSKRFIRKQKSRLILSDLPRDC